MDHLKAYGWNSHFAGQLAPGEELAQVARVIQEHKESYLVEAVGAGRGKIWAEISGKMRHQGTVREDFPAVGDWVMLRGMKNSTSSREDGPVQIYRILPRRSVLSRRLESGEEQLLAVNVDVAFLGTSLNDNFNLRRLERYLALSSSAGVQPVVLLTKADLCPDPSPFLQAIEPLLASSNGATVHAVSVVSGQGMEAVRNYLTAGITAVILGSSGVGKSTLVNYLADSDVQDMMEAREFDDKGRHCTTFRHLVRTTTGGLIIDTPGLRGLALGESADALLGTFSDIEAIAAACHFRDCQHQSEPGCAIKAAVETGQLDAGRLEGYLKLHREVAAHAARENRVADRKQRKMEKKTAASKEKRGRRNWGE